MKTQKVLYGLFVLFFVVFFCLNIYAQTDYGFIYAKVHTRSGEEFQGRIRWANVEAFWFDFFKAGKTKNEYLQFLSQIEFEELRKKSSCRSAKKYKGRGFHEDGKYIHEFICQFGDIKSISILEKKKTALHLKNEAVFELASITKYLGNYLSIWDEKSGNIKLDWERVEKIDFKAFGPKSTKPESKALWGTVYTRYGEISGYIQWDTDERLSTDLLTGKTHCEDIKIAFESIKMIKKDFWGASVIMQSGEELHLFGSNDVNYDNRGIVIKTQNFGTVYVPWFTFKKVIFEDKALFELPKYQDYTNPKLLQGKITTTDDVSYTGTIVYNLDKTYDAEFLSGKSEYTTYHIPFSLVHKMYPKKKSARVILQNGKELELEKTQDVSKHNDGVLVFQKKDQHKYIPWKLIKEIVFQ